MPEPNLNTKTKKETKKIQSGTHKLMRIKVDCLVKNRKTSLALDGRGLG
jgi:hypothetical protein